MKLMEICSIMVMFGYLTCQSDLWHIFTDFIDTSLYIQFADFIEFNKRIVEKLD